MAAALEKCRFSPFLTSSARGSKSPKREVSYGQEALLTLSSGVLSRPSISSMPSPQPPTPHLPTPTVRNFPIFQGPTLHQPSSSTHLRQAPLSFTSPDSSHPQGVLQTLPPQRLPKQNHWPATQSGSSSPPRFLPTFSWGRLEGAEIGFSPPRRTPTAQQWQGAHSPTRGRSRSGVIPESQWGRLRRRGRGCRKRQLQLPGCQARSLPPPPAHRLPIGPRVWPRPMGEPREAPPPGLTPPAGLPPHKRVGCYSRLPLRRASPSEYRPRLPLRLAPLCKQAPTTQPGPHLELGGAARNPC